MISIRQTSSTPFIKALVSTGELNEVGKPTMLISTISSLKQRSMMQNRHTKKFSATDTCGVYVIGDMIVYVESSDSNTNVRFYRGWDLRDSLPWANSIRVNRFRADCGSCSKKCQ